ncbi:hypothetical protein FQN57_002338 [Myotisia sp. PD_48]|nr:hypothetical protein FQN57_002338 [Myotisia sp. PD_48]
MALIHRIRPNWHLSRQLLALVLPQKNVRFSFRTVCSSTANKIQASMQRPGHIKWGWVIYRCAYNDDIAWIQLLKDLRDQFPTSKDKENNPSLVNGYELTVRDDRHKFEGASIEEILYYHRRWAISEDGGKAEQPKEADYWPDLQDRHRLFLSPRYNFCLHVDEGSLHSVLHPEGPFMSYVNMINTIYDLSNYDYEERDDPPPWARVSTYGLAFGTYSGLITHDLWHSSTRRPPVVSGLF